MPNLTYETALIVGAGSGLSASLARLFSREGLRVALAARNSEKLGALCAETGIGRLIPHHFGLFAFNTLDPAEIALAAARTTEPGLLSPDTRHVFLLSRGD